RGPSAPGPLRADESGRRTSKPTPCGPTSTPSSRARAAGGAAAGAVDTVTTRAAGARASRTAQHDSARNRGMTPRYTMGAWGHWPFIPGFQPLITLLRARVVPEGRLHREQAVEERAIALQRDAQIFGRDVVAAIP